MNTCNIDISALRDMARSQREWTIGMRRALHEIPEKSGEEYKTQALILSALAELGIAHAPVLTGAVGVIYGANPGRTAALRADIDALPVNEPPGLPFRSKRDGFMHACGHDAHAAILLGAAKLLSERRGAWRGAVKVIFQPSEERGAGAANMIAAGAMSNPDADVIYGLHVMPHLPVGIMETRGGTLNASSDSLTFEVTGKGCHGAYPDMGADAIVCAAQLVNALQTLVSRNVPPAQAAVFTVGMIEGGTAHNIICERATMRGTLRTANPALRELMLRRISEIATGVASACGCRVRVEALDACKPLVNDASEAMRALNFGKKLLGAENALERESPSMGAEDFASYLECAPGAFYHIGCADPNSDSPAAPLHSRDFQLDERCLEIGVMMQAGLAMGI
jgi:amidohydrolase